VVILRNTLSIGKMNIKSCEMLHNNFEAVKYTLIHEDGLELRIICVQATMAARSKTWTVFARSNTEIVGFESHSMHGCLCEFLCVSVFLCR
jgi:hypothetical protein